MQFFTMPLMFAVLAAAVAAAVMRMVAIYCNRKLFWQGFVGDSSIHFTIIRQLRKNRRSKYIDQYLIRYEPMSYPTAFHRYCSIFPLRAIELHPYLPSYVIFVASAAGFALYFHYVSTVLLSGGSALATLVATGAFILMPGQYTFAGPGLAYMSLSERLLARVSTATFIIASLVGSQFHDVPSLLIAATGAAVGLTVALFSRQALLFVVPIMSLLLLDWYPLATLGLGLLAAFVLSRSYFILSMKHTIQQWSLYATHTKRSAVIRANLSRFTTWKDLRAAHSFLGVVWRIIQHEPGRTMLHCPEVPLAAIVLAFCAYQGHSLAGFGVWPLAAAIIASGIVFLATASDRFNHLGECYRYLEYGLYFSLPMIFGLFAIGYWPQGSWILAALLAVSLPSVYLIYVFFGQWKNWPEHDLISDVAEGMNLSDDAVVFPVGMPVAADVCARRPNVKSFWYQPGLISKDIYEDFIEGWPFLKLDGGGIIEKFNVTHAIVDKGYLQYLPGPCRLPGMKQVYENSRYTGYLRVRQADNSAQPADVVVLQKPALAPATV